jgi:hypothetical protein
LTSRKYGISEYPVPEMLPKRALANQSRTQKHTRVLKGLRLNWYRMKAQSASPAMVSWFPKASQWLVVVVVVVVVVVDAVRIYDMRGRGGDSEEG